MSETEKDQFWDDFDKEMQRRWEVSAASGKNEFHNWWVKVMCGKPPANAVDPTNVAPSKPIL